MAFYKFNWDHNLNKTYKAFKNEDFWPRQGHKQDLVSSAAPLA